MTTIRSPPVTPGSVPLMRTARARPPAASVTVWPGFSPVAEDAKAESVANTAWPSTRFAGLPSSRGVTWTARSGSRPTSATRSSPTRAASSMTGLTSSTPAVANTRP